MTPKHLLTIFTAPKPFTDPHIAIIQRNAICSWAALGPQVEVLIIGKEPGLAEAAAGLGARHLPEVARNAHGTPLVSSIFDLARQASDSPLLAYVNADVMLTPDVLTVAQRVVEQAEKFLIVGQRWDLDLRSPWDFSPGWESRLKAEVKSRGRLHPPAGSDYFVFPRACFADIPKFAIGRAGWDNWMIFHARWQGWPVVDATTTLIVIHQDHDYNHLPNGQPHYRLPETYTNTRLAGGRRAIFHLEDADFHLTDNRLTPIPRRGQKFWREAETFPLIRLHSFALAELFFAIFHPVKAWGEWRGWLAYKAQQLARKRPA
jgi:hypothetical protein